MHRIPRRRRRSALIPVLVLAAHALGGCAYGYKNVTLSPRIDAPTAARVAITGISRSDANAGEVDALGFALAQKLRASGRFTSVTVRRDGADGKEDDLLIQYEVTGIKRVSSEMRALFGAFMGRGWIQAHVRLRRGDDGTTLGEADIEGFSSGGTAFAGTTGQAIDKAADAMADFVLARGT